MHDAHPFQKKTRDFWRAASSTDSERRDGFRIEEKAVPSVPTTTTVLFVVIQYGGKHREIATRIFVSCLRRDFPLFLGFLGSGGSFPLPLGGFGALPEQFPLVVEKGRLRRFSGIFNLLVIHTR